MRFMMINKTNEHFEAGNPPSPELLARMGAFMEETAKSGVLLQAEGLMPSVAGARVSVRNGSTTVIDGPFAEAKELIGGFAVIQARSREEAVQWAFRFAAVHGDDVVVEIRQLSEMADVESVPVG